MNHAEARGIVIGIGHPDRGDDGAGPAVVAALDGSVPEGWRVFRHSGEAATLMEAWRGGGIVLVVDATQTGAAPGSVLELDLLSTRLPEGVFRCSTHSFSLPEAVELSKVLGCLPRVLRLYGIEGFCFDHGKPLTPGVSEGVTEVAGRIRERWTKENNDDHA